MKLSFKEPIFLKEHFCIPVDTTPWGGKHQSLKNGWSPVRQRAQFKNIAWAMIPESKVAHTLNQAAGVYVLAISLPQPAIYVGIASGVCIAPEGILRRMCKHRIKLTGSHVGHLNTSTGGVHHTRIWRSFAAARATFFAEQQMQDDCSDVRLIVGSLDLRDDLGQNNKPILDKPILEKAESFISLNCHGIQTAMNELLWPEFAGNVALLTGAFRRNLVTSPLEIELWNRNIYIAD